MTLPKPHSDWKLDVVPVPLTQWIGSDELLTQLWLRLAYDNQLTTRNETPRKLVAEIASLMEGDRTRFEGFSPGAGTAETWLRSDLLKVLKRTPDQFTVARPLHLSATRLRNVRKESDANASAIPYAWLVDTAPDVVDDLKSWLRVEGADVDELGDLPAYGLARLADEEGEDIVLGRLRSVSGPMLCPKRGQLFAEDLRALLVYRAHFPRAVIVDHIRRLTTLHIGLHLLHTFEAVAAIAGDPDASCGCDQPEASECRWMPRLVADCGEDARSGAARLAETSWAQVEQNLASYVRAHLRLRKLKEFAESGRTRRKFDTSTVRGIAKVPFDAPAAAFAEWARSRIDMVANAGSEFSDLAEQYEALGLDSFDIYMSLLYADGERRWFAYHRQVLDSLFGKNERDGAMKQPLGGRRRRRLAISPAILETIVLVAMVRFSGSEAHTRSLRVDELVDRLAQRYGLLVATPPDGSTDDPSATRSMLENNQTFRTRLRQAGLFVDQSDAFLTQTIRPRVTLA